ALYRNPSVLVMDEATSALDNQTEKDVMAAIDGLSGKKTIILIAHRLSTLKKCDQIFYLEKGVITRRGTYEELFADEN
ncbi:MAG: ABC transporter ATP-binding protein, partial [Treponema sp.]|nr:ABC transporter ATP-binding protein [Treponema sp.]